MWSAHVARGEVYGRRNIKFLNIRAILGIRNFNVRQTRSRLLVDKANNLIRKLFFLTEKKEVCPDETEAKAFNEVSLDIDFRHDLVTWDVAHPTFLAVVRILEDHRGWQVKDLIMIDADQPQQSPAISQLNREKISWHLIFLLFGEFLWDSNISLITRVY